MFKDLYMQRFMLRQIYTVYYLCFDDSPTLHAVQLKVSVGYKCVDL